MSVNELGSDNEMLQNQLEILIASLEQNYLINSKILKNQMELIASDLGTKVPSFKLSELEKNASTIFPETSDELKSSGFGIERSLRELPKETLEKYSYGNIASTTELCTLINGSNSALDIKKMLDTQYRRKSELQSVINYLELLKVKGLITF